MNKKHRVSMKDMAKELGVSIPTISRALNDSPEISKSLKEKIRQLAKDLGYRPNPFAQSLKKGTTKLIGVVVPDFTRHFHASVISGIEAVASEEGYGVVCCNSHECYEDEMQCLESLTSLHVEGIVACLAQDTTDYSHFERLKTLNIPLVFFARTCLPEIFSSVISDGVDGAYQATLHLAQQGCKRIAFVGGPNHLDMTQRRKQGYLDALHESRLQVNPALVRCGSLEFDFAYAATKELLEQDNCPDAILAANDTIIYGVLMATRDLKKRIPEDVAIIGFTDNPDVEYVSPAISAISDKARPMGRLAAKMLLAEVEHGAPVCHEKLDMKLHLRESSLKKK